MGFDDHFRMSVHGVITDSENRALLLRATYAEKAWGLPGGALEPGETVHEALVRECREELGSDVEVRYLSGVYLHTSVNSHALIFRCKLPEGADIRLSEEHAEWRFFPLEEMLDVQRIRVADCLNFDGQVRSRRF